MIVRWYIFLQLVFLTSDAVLTFVLGVGIKGSDSESSHAEAFQVVAFLVLRLVCLPPGVRLLICNSNIN
jgi:hypothetical protein